MSNSGKGDLNMKNMHFSEKNYELKMHIGEIFIQKNLHFINI
jgi:hypothetical protein